MDTGSDFLEVGSDTYEAYQYDPSDSSGQTTGSTISRTSDEFLYQNSAYSQLAHGSQVASNIPPIVFCDEHKTEHIKYFCDDHKMLTCDLCIASNHLKCTRTALRDKISKKNKSNLDKVVKKMKKMQMKVDILRSTRRSDLDLLYQTTKQSINEIHELRRKITELYNALERNAFTALEKAMQVRDRELKHQVVTCENVLKNIDDSIKEIQDCQSSMNGEIMFIIMTKSSHKVEELKTIAKEVDSGTTRGHLTLPPNKIVEEMLHQMKDFSNVVDTAGNKLEPAGKNVLEMTISSSPDIKINTDALTSSTFLPNGDLVLCDYSKSKLFLCDPTFTLKDEMILQEKPWNSCPVADTEIVITLPEQRQIQFVSTEMQLRPGATLTVDRKCYGIDCHGGLMYVTCHDKPGNGEVLVMTMDGHVQRRLGMYEHEQGRCMFTSPDYVRVSRTSDRVFVSDLNTNLVTCLTQLGEVVYQYKHKELSGPTGIYVDKEDNILVCGCWSQNVHCVDKHGVHHSILARQSDGVVWPNCVSYRSTDQALVFGMENRPASMVVWLRNKDQQC